MIKFIIGLEILLILFLLYLAITCKEDKNDLSVSEIFLGILSLGFPFNKRN